MTRWFVPRAVSTQSRVPGLFCQLFLYVELNNWRHRELIALRKTLSTEFVVCASNVPCSLCSLYLPHSLALSIIFFAPSVSITHKLTHTSERKQEGKKITPTKNPHRLNSPPIAGFDDAAAREATTKYKLMGHYKLLTAEASENLTHVALCNFCHAHTQTNIHSCRSPLTRVMLHYRRK